MHSFSLEEKIQNEDLAKEFWLNFTKKSKQNKTCLIKTKKLAM